MKEYYWCRKLLANNEYYYVYVTKEYAIMLLENLGYEINIDPSEITEKIKNEKGEDYD